MAATMVCMPMGICSFDYRLEYCGQKASSILNKWGESGELRLKERTLPIHKAGFFSSHWTLLFDGTALATAEKTSIFSSTLEVVCRERHLILRMESIFSRGVRVEESDCLVARIAPLHAFTRRAVMEVPDEDEDFILLAFLFWLVQMMWRRRARRAHTNQNT